MIDIITLFYLEMMDRENSIVFSTKKLIRAVWYKTEVRRSFPEKIRKYQ